MPRCAPHGCSEDPQKNRVLVTPIPATNPAEHATPKTDGTEQPLHHACGPMGRKPRRKAQGEA